jgi:regulator of PEP synthase PpsR (kinase-PPPase family)
MPERTVFFVSDGTGITAETFGNSILAQFAAKPRHVRRPFIDTIEKAHQVRAEIDQTAEREGKRPIVFVTLVREDVRDILTGGTGQGCKGMVMDMFRTFVEPLELEFGVKSNHRVGRFTDVSKSQEYSDRIEASRTTTARVRATWPRPMSSCSACRAAARRRPACTWPCSTASRPPTAR